MSSASSRRSLLKPRCTTEIRIGEGSAGHPILHRDIIANEASICLDIELSIVEVRTFDEGTGDDVKVEKADWEKYGVM